MIEIERYHEGRTLLIILSNDKALNIIDDATLQAIAKGLQEAEVADNVCSVVVCANGKHFAVGANVKELLAKDKQQLLNDDRSKHWRMVADFGKPLLVAVQGMALGAGNELAMQGDIVHCDETAHFGQPEIKLGLIPGAGGTQRLTRAIGKARAMQMVLTGQAIDAAEALAAGLVSKICKPELLRENILAQAAVLSQYSPIALRAAKRCVLAAAEASLQAGLGIECKEFASLADTQDRNEGIRAFLEKRPPNFKGK